MSDTNDLKSRWAANDAELNRIAAMSPLERAMHASREDELLDKQDEIELKLCQSIFAPSSSRSRSGT